MNEKLLLKAQRNEMTEHFIYSHLAIKCKNEKNTKVLEHISRDELRHHDIIKSFTKQEVKPNYWRIRWFVFIATLFGLSFSLKYMERGEQLAQVLYKQSKNPKLKRLWKDEHVHEKKILRLLEDERVEYAGSIVLGLNDALVELSGALAGFTLAIRNTSIIALIGFITGFAAALSMAASGFLSSREEATKGKNPARSALYTGVAYITVVILLILPYILFNNHWIALIVMLAITIGVIATYTFYISVVKEIKFSKRFLEMAAISLGVAIISFFVGLLLKSLTGIDI